MGNLQARCRAFREWLLSLARQCLFQWPVARASMKHRIFMAYRTVANWSRRHPAESAALGVLGLFVLVIVIECTLIADRTDVALGAFDQIVEPEKKIEAYSKLISAVGLAVAAPVGFLGVMLAFWRTLNQHRDGVLAARKLEAESYAKAAEAFAKAVDHLGSEKISIRMGAVLALEALGKSTPRLLSQAIEILCAYLREANPVQIKNNNQDISGALIERNRCPTDIELIVSTISRLKDCDTEDKISIDLSFSDLRMINIPRANLKGANFSGSNLMGAVLVKADLRGSTLICTNLSASVLDGAWLEKADLGSANFQRTSLQNANLRGALMSLTKMEKAILRYSDLRRARLYEVDFNLADLSGANLTGSRIIRSEFGEANLTGANLIGVKITGSIFSDTCLPNGRIWSGVGCPPEFERVSAPAAPAQE